MLNQVYQEMERKMARAAEALKAEVAGSRTGRANPGLLEGIKVQSYGSLVPLNQVAGVSVPEPRLLVIQPWDKTALPEIEKAILKSELGLTPMNDGRVIRLPIPTLTEERRKELVKTARHYAEEGRIAIRNIRREALEKLKKLSKELHLSEDDTKRAEAEIQKITADFIAKADELLEKKEQEILG
jgi:ribosome recycling factor